MGGKSFPKRKCVQKPKILLKNSLPFLLKGDEEQDANPNSIIMLSPILCFSFLCGNFLLIASPTKTMACFDSHHFCAPGRACYIAWGEVIEGIKKGGWWGACQGKKVDPWKNMGVSENSGTPKSSILIGFSIINHPILGYPYFWKHPYEKSAGLENHLEASFCIFFLGGEGAGGKFYSSVSRVLGDFLVDHLHGRLVSQ